MLDGFGRVGISATKGRGKVLTETDLAVEPRHHRNPRARVPGTAGTQRRNRPPDTVDGWLWVIDPVDGTKNFSRGIPHFCFTIALCHENGPAGGPDAPAFVERGVRRRPRAGVRLNGRPVHVSGAAAVQESIVAVDMGYDDSAWPPPVGNGPSPLARDAVAFRIRDPLPSESPMSPPAVGTSPARRLAGLGPRSGTAPRARSGWYRHRPRRKSRNYLQRRPQSRPPRPSTATSSGSRVTFPGRLSPPAVVARPRSP